MHWSPIQTLVLATDSGGCALLEICDLEWSDLDCMKRACGCPNSGHLSNVIIGGIWNGTSWCQKKIHALNLAKGTLLSSDSDWQEAASRKLYGYPVVLLRNYVVWRGIAFSPTCFLPARILTPPRKEFANLFLALLFASLQDLEQMPKMDSSPSLAQPKQFWLPRQALEGF